MEKNEGKPQETFESYTVMDGQLQASVKIVKRKGEHVKAYLLDVPKLEEGTKAFLKDIQPELLKRVSISTQEALNLKMAEQLKAKFLEAGTQLIKNGIPNVSPARVQAIAQRLVQEMLGLGDMEFLLRDGQIEEICINGASQPVWVYHRKHGWIRTNLKLEGENQIWTYASSIARGVGRQINTQSPLLDAYISTGDRVNATIFPISYFGNTITIRKFARKPWTITDYIRTKTISSEVAALLWLAVQYEMNVIVAGGTGAGKTSMLNVLAMFVPENQRIVSIEQTREVTLPTAMQWTPLVVREPTGEGTGKVSMLDLMVNSLRMRPDRIIVGEIRRAEEAEVLFEAMHTGHSVYATLHAETVQETLNRLTNPPINIPKITLRSLHLVLAMHRDRRNNIRRVFELGEVVPSGASDVKENLLYCWDPSKDEIVKESSSARLISTLKLYTSMDESDIKRDLEDKRKVLDYLVDNGINGVDEVFEMISAYYDDPEEVMKKVRRK